METPEKEIVFVQKEGDFHPKIHIFWEIWQKLFTKQKKKCMTVFIFLQKVSRKSIFTDIKNLDILHCFDNITTKKYY